MPKEITQIICYNVWTGDGNGSYDAGATYDELVDMIADVTVALEHGRSVLIEQELMTRVDYDAGGDLDPETIKRLRGEN